MSIMTIFSNMVKVVSRYWGLLLEGTVNTLLDRCDRYCYRFSSRPDEIEQFQNW